MTGITPLSIAKSMLREAEIKGCPGAYYAAGHSTDNISILHQQVRCINLSWAMVKLRRVKHGSVVGIVGAGFSGLMLAVTLALQRRCIVYVYEKEQRLLDRFRSSTYRFISTNLNSRDLSVGYQPAISAPIYDSPIFAWTEGTASEVAHQWLREFQTYYMRLPIFLQTSSEVTACRRDDVLNVVKLQVTTANNHREEAVDVAILSVGFGSDHNPLDIQDWSYWGSGSPLQYRPGRRSQKKERVLISGCGDSGIVELMHYVFQDFKHQYIADYYPSGCGIESYIQPKLEQSRFWDIRYNGNVTNFEGKVISELCWFYFAKRMRDHNPNFTRESAKGLVGINKKVHDLYENLIARMTGVLLQHGISADTTQPSAHYSDRFEQQIAEITQAKQFKIRDIIGPSIAELASMELDQKVGGMDLGRFVDLKDYHKQLLGRFEIWMNDDTPTVYNEKIAPVNLIYLRLCQSVEKVRFVRGRLELVDETSSGYRVAFKNRSTMTFDRVATRFGTRHDEVAREMIGSNPRRMHFGDWLLEVARSQRSRIDADGHAYNQRFAAAREAVAHAAGIFANSRPPRRDKKLTVPKSLYLGSLAFPDVFASDPILSDAEGWLRERLRRGLKITYSQSGGADL